MNNLEQLEQLTEKLMPLKAKTVGAGYTEYIGEDNTFMGFGLYNDPSVAVQRIFMSAGTEIAKHNHKEKEFVIVVSGKFRVKVEGKSWLCGKGDSVYLESMQLHSGSICEDTWCVCITIPASKDYPSA